MTEITMMFRLSVRLPARSASAAMASLSAASLATVSLLLLDGPTALVSFMLGLAMLAIAMSDASRLIVPDIVSLPAVPAGLIATAILDGGPAAQIVVLEHAAAALTAACGLYLVGALYRLRRGHDGLGLGDVKLAAVAGAWTGWQGIPAVLLLACLAALTAVFIHSVVNKREVTRTTVVPFGAFLAPAIWLVWVMLHLQLLPA